jgi:hypothetical protein
MIQGKLVGSSRNFHVIDRTHGCYLGPEQILRQTRVANHGLAIESMYGPLEGIWMLREGRMTTDRTCQRIS